MCKDTKKWATIAGRNPSAWISTACHSNIGDEVCNNSYSTYRAVSIDAYHFDNKS